MTRVAIFTDNDFSKVNGVTTTLKALLRHAPSDIQARVYTLSDVAAADPGYLALRSWGLPIPFYSEMAVYAPRLGEFRRHLRDEQVGVVHVSTPGPVGLAARLLAPRARLRLVGSFHTHLTDYALRLSGSELLAAGMARYLRWLYATCDRVMVPSDDTRRRLESAGWPGERLSEWTRGVDTHTFSPARRSAALRAHWQVSEHRPALLYAGRVSREKDLALLPYVMAELCDRQCAYRLIVVGSGPMLPELRAACPDAVFTGTLSHDEVAIAMASADAFIFPSTTDTAGNVVLEAQACGLPVIVSDRGGPRENMHDGLTGLVCEAGRVDVFADAAEQLAKPDRRARFSAAARRYAAGRSWEQSLAPLWALYRQAAPDPSRANRTMAAPHRLPADAAAP